MRGDAIERSYTREVNIEYSLNLMKTTGYIDYAEKLRVDNAIGNSKAFGHFSALVGRTVSMRAIRSVHLRRSLIFDFFY